MLRRRIIVFMPINRNDTAKWQDNRNLKMLVTDNTSAAQNSKLCWRTSAAPCCRFPSGSIIYHALLWNISLNRWSSCSFFFPHFLYLALWHAHMQICCHVRCSELNLALTGGRAHHNTHSESVTARHDTIWSAVFKYPHGWPHHETPAPIHHSNLQGRHTGGHQSLLGRFRFPCALSEFPGNLRIGSFHFISFGLVLPARFKHFSCLGSSAQGKDRGNRSSSVAGIDWIER